MNLLLKMQALLLLLILFVVQGCPRPQTLQPMSSEQQIVCPRTSSGEKMKLAVMDFEIKVANAKRKLGAGISDMLLNALVETQCFRIFERSRVNDILKEQRGGLTGSIDPATAAKVGKMVGAQFLVMGTVTEFQENVSGGGGGGILPIPKVAGVLGFYKSHIGFIIRIVDSTTGEILVSKSIDKKVTKMGFAGGSGLLGAFAGGGFYKSQAMQDAFEQAVNESVLFITSRLGNMDIQTAEASKSAYSKTSTPPTPSNCSGLTGPAAGRIMVVIPEVHIRRRIPDPAGETEIIKRFLEAGFQVVDQQQINAIRYQEKVLNAVKNPSAAASLGAEFDADIVVVGEAFSEFASRENNMISCRARVEARAVQTSTGQILVADGKHGAGLDVAEFVAAKTALRNAGTQIAGYFIPQLCKKMAGSGEMQASSVEIFLSNINFRRMKQFVTFVQKLPGVQQVRNKMTGKTARIHVQYSGSANELANAISAGNDSSLTFRITNLSANKMDIKVTGQHDPEKQKLVRQIQLNLHKLGYDPGPVDGMLGSQTKSAIRQFQKDVNTPVNGEVSVQLLNLMKSKLI